MTTELTTQIQLESAYTGITESRMQELAKPFIPMIRTIEEILEPHYRTIINQKEITVALTEQAMRLCKDIAKVRCLTEKVRKEQKNESLRTGKAIDGVSNIIKYAIEGKEDELKKIANHFIILEDNRKRELGVHRLKKIREFYEFKKIPECPTIILSASVYGAWDENVWDNYFTGLCAKITKSAHQNKLEDENQCLRKEVSLKNESIVTIIAKEKEQGLSDREKTIAWVQSFKLPVAPQVENGYFSVIISHVIDVFEKNKTDKIESLMSTQEK